MTPDATLARTFLRTLYGHADEGWLTLFSIDPANGRQRVDWAEVNDLDGLIDTAMERAERSHVWYGIATRRERLSKGRGGAKDCLAIPGYWLDVDIEGPNHKTDKPLPLDVDHALEFIGEFPTPPTLIVKTGGGLQPIWAFGEMVPAEDAVPMLADWQSTWSEIADDYGVQLDNTSDLARVLRLPGSYNRKVADDPQPVTIMEMK